MTNDFKKTGILSFPAFFRGLGYSGWHNSTEVSSLKTATLLYDRLLVAAPQPQVKHACDHFAYEYGLEVEQLLEVWGSIEEVQEGILYCDSFFERCQATIGLFESSGLDSTREVFGSYWYNGLLHTGQLHILSLVTLPLWSVAQEIMSGIAAIETPDLPNQGKASEFQNAVYPKRTEDIWNEVSGAGVPDPGSLTWNSIVQLSTSRNKQAFQNYLLHLADRQLDKSIINGLWEVFETTNPNIGTMIAKSVISEIPLPLPVNPISILFSIQDVIESYKKRSENTWLSFLAEVRDHKDDVVDQPPSSDAFGWAGRLHPKFMPPELPGIPKER